MMTLLLAASPFGLAFWLLLCRWPTVRVGLFTFGYLLLVILLDRAFALPAGTAGMALATGTTTALSILIIIFPALLLYHLQRTTGTLHLLVEQVRVVFADQHLLVLVLVLSLCPLLEALCGFGVSILVVAPVLLLLNIHPTRVLLLCLLGQATVAWGAMGVAITLAAHLTASSAPALGSLVSLLSAPLLLLVGIATLVVIDGRQALTRWGWVVGCQTLLFTAVTWLCSQWLSVTVASLLASLASGLFFSGVAAFQDKAPRREAQRQHRGAVPTARALVPYASLLLLLLLSRLLPPPPWFQQHLTVAVVAWHWNFALLSSPGFWIALTIGLSLLVLKPTWHQFAQAVQATIQQCSPVAVTTLSFLWVADLMQANGMLALLGHAVAGTLGTQYRWVAPWLAAVSGWLTGSVVGGNSALALLQTALAREAGWSPLALLATQTVGAAAGRMLAPSCLMLVRSATQVPEAELLLVRKGGLLIVGMLLLALTCWLNTVLALSWITVGVGMLITLSLAVVLVILLEASVRPLPFPLRLTWNSEQAKESRAARNTARPVSRLRMWYSSGEMTWSRREPLAARFPLSDAGSCSSVLSPPVRSKERTRRWPEQVKSPMRMWPASIPGNQQRATETLPGE
jgi:lactate permease